MAVRRRTEAEEGKDISPAMGRARQPRTFSGKKKTAAAAGDWCMLHSARTHRGRGGRKEEGGTAEKRKRPLHGVSRSRGRSNSMHSDGVWCGVIPAGRGASRAPTTPQNAVDDVLPIFLWIKQIIYK